jgi:hypothetical protein
MFLVQGCFPIDRLVDDAITDLVTVYGMITNPHQLRQCFKHLILMRYLGMGTNAEDVGVLSE